MTKPLLLVLTLLLLAGCGPNKMPPPYERVACHYKKDNPLLTVYNDVLIELVETRGYQLYLNKSLNIDSLWKTSPLYDLKDSSAIYAELNRIHHLFSQHQKSTFNNPKKWCTAYLDSQLIDFKMVLKSLPSEMDKELWTSLQMDSSAWQKYTPDSLQLVKAQLNYRDFQACTFKIEPESAFSSQSPSCSIGHYKFSTVVLNSAKDKGWLYYEFVCGGTCGRGEIITIEKQHENWVIKDSKMLWIS
ncbi:hypothetical protein [Rufibacter aurantiacus]|uniref:hypothetical protein n=1 Tax=Rufibacter aurantiacus TaxID=2817374 RepID=UPI001B301E27|nr:hypothetical protein [Rufibacter aurantiacus]